MTAITVRKDVKHQEANVLSYPVKASTKIVEGALVNLTGGYATNATDTASDIFVGVADETADNSAVAVDGNIRVKVVPKGVIEVVAGFSAAATDCGVKVYAMDNQTVGLAATTTNDILVGRIVEVVSASKLRVAITPFA